MQKEQLVKHKSKFSIDEWANYNQQVVNSLTKFDLSYQDQIIENKNNISLIKKQFIKLFKNEFPNSMNAKKFFLIKKILLCNQLKYFSIIKETKNQIYTIQNSWSNIPNLKNFLSSINLKANFDNIPDLTIDPSYLNKTLIYKIQKDNSEYLEVSELTSEWEQVSLFTIIEISNKHLFESKIINNFVSLITNLWLSLSTKKNYLQQISLLELLNVLATQFNKSWAKEILEIVKNPKKLSNEEFLKIILNFNLDKQNKIILDKLLIDLDNTINEYKVVLDNVYSRYTLTLNMINKKNRLITKLNHSDYKVLPISEKDLHSKYLLDIYNSIKSTSKKSTSNQVVQFLTNFYYEKTNGKNNIKFNPLRKICINYYFQKINIQNAIIYQLAKLINNQNTFILDSSYASEFNDKEIKFLASKINELNQLKINNVILKTIISYFDYIQISLNDFKKMSELDSSEWFINYYGSIKLIEK